MKMATYEQNNGRIRVNKEIKIPLLKKVLRYDVSLKLSTNVWHNSFVFV